MSKIILVTGGARSGKSGFAESLCREQNNSTAYIATSVAFDDEMKERVRKHQESRPKEWKTYEIYKDIYKIIKELGEKHQTVILDCITLLVNNLMFVDGIDIDKASEQEINDLEAYIKDQVKKLIEEVKMTDLYFVMVTNEIGSVSYTHLDVYKRQIGRCGWITSFLRRITYCLILRVHSSKLVL